MRMRLLHVKKLNQVNRLRPRREGAGLRFSVGDISSSGNLRLFCEFADGKVSRRRRGSMRFLKSVAFANKSVTKQTLLQHFSR